MHAPRVRSLFSFRSYKFTPQTTMVLCIGWANSQSKKDQPTNPSQQDVFVVFSLFFSRDSLVLFEKKTGAFRTIDRKPHDHHTMTTMLGGLSKARFAPFMEREKRPFQISAKPNFHPSFPVSVFPVLCSDCSVATQATQRSQHGDFWQWLHSPPFSSFHLNDYV